jgi:hypothetical protein
LLANAVGQNREKNVIVVNIDESAIDTCKAFIKLYVDAFGEKKKFFPS